jgi:hypothetical protein
MISIAAVDEPDLVRVPLDGRQKKAVVDELFHGPLRNASS